MEKKKMLILVVLFIALLGCMAAKEVKEAPLRIITYNIRYDNPGDGIDNWKYRRDYIYSMLRYQQPDIFCIQEGLHNQVSDLAIALPDYKWCGVGRDDGDELGEYSAVFYNKDRFKLLDKGNFWLSATPEEPSMGWDAACIRICTWGELRDKASGKEFFVFNTHFDHVGKIARENSARLIIERISALSHGKPVLLTGDFNAPDTDIVYQILTTNTGFGDTSKVSALPHHGPKQTWFGFYPGAEANPEGIDFIFSSQGIQTLKHATLSEVMANGHFPSDHLPVLAEIILP